MGIAITSIEDIVNKLKDKHGDQIRIDASIFIDICTKSRFIDKDLGGNGIKKNNLNKYGVEHTLQLPEQIEKNKTKRQTLEALQKKNDIRLARNLRNNIKKQIKRKQYLEELNDKGISPKDIFIKNMQNRGYFHNIEGSAIKNGMEKI